MLSKHQFKLKLSDIAKAYSTYLDKIIYDDDEIAPKNFKFSLILTMIEDLYYGSIKNQESARNFLMEIDLNKVNAALHLPNGMLEKLIYSPESYAEHIVYEEELEDDLFI